MRVQISFYQSDDHLLKTVRDEMELHDILYMVERAKAKGFKFEGRLFMVDDRGPEFEADEDGFYLAIILLARSGAEWMDI